MAQIVSAEFGMVSPRGDPPAEGRRPAKLEGIVVGRLGLSSKKNERVFRIVRSDGLQVDLYFRGQPLTFRTLYRNKVESLRGPLQVLLKEVLPIPGEPLSERADRGLASILGGTMTHPTSYVCSLTVASLEGLAVALSESVEEENAEQSVVAVRVYEDAIRLGLEAPEPVRTWAVKLGAAHIDCALGTTAAALTGPAYRPEDDAAARAMLDDEGVEHVSSSTLRIDHEEVDINAEDAMEHSLPAQSRSGVEATMGSTTTH